MENNARVKGAEYLPMDFVNRMEAMLGDKADDFFSSYQKNPEPSLRINPLKYNSDINEIEDLDCVSWEKNGRYYPEDMAFGKNPLHAAGVYYIQEASAMAPVTFLNAKPGDVILDLCAAPGGKSTQIAGYMKGEGLLVSNEIVPKRARILSENIERLGIKNALVISSEPDKLAERLDGYFDKILVDAPCSGEGMFRKHNEAAGEWSIDNVKLCAKRQGDILEAACRMLKYGGRLVYSTCTFAPLEDEISVYRFLKAHPDMRLCDISGIKPDDSNYPVRISGITVPDDIDEADFKAFLEGSAFGMWRLWPQEIKGEGHFLAVFEKGDCEEVQQGGFLKSAIRGNVSKALKKVFYEALPEYLTKETLEEIKEREDRLYLIGDGLYLLPEIMPSIDSLKVLRAGLKLGDFIRGRFEASHALALSLKPSGAKTFYEADYEETLMYLKGMTVNAKEQLSKGWVLICHRGYSVGWGKCVNGVIKNHYPKGLRWM